MIESWRWYGPFDQIGLDEIAQTGARGLVTALHQIPYDQVWPRATIAAFELFVLGRDGAADDYCPEALNKAVIWFQASTDDDRQALLTAIMSGLPGAYDRYDVAGLKKALHHL